MNSIARAVVVSHISHELSPPPCSECRVENLRSGSSLRRSRRVGSNGPQAGRCRGAQHVHRSIRRETIAASGDGPGVGGRERADQQLRHFLATCRHNRRERSGAQAWTGAAGARGGREAAARRTVPGCRCRRGESPLLAAPGKTVARGGGGTAPVRRNAPVEPCAAGLRAIRAFFERWPFLVHLCGASSWRCR